MLLLLLDSRERERGVVVDGKLLLLGWLEERGKYHGRKTSIFFHPG
jgi:hypothetical protein